MEQVDGRAFSLADLPAGTSAVAFTTDWCGYCRRFYPHLKGERKLWLVDISDEDDPLWDDLRIDVVPTVILFKDGEEQRRWAGVLREAHAQEIRAALA